MTKYENQEFLSGLEWLHEFGIQTFHSHMSTRNFKLSETSKKYDDLKIIEEIEFESYYAKRVNSIMFLNENDKVYVNIKSSKRLHKKIERCQEFLNDLINELNCHYIKDVKITSSTFSIDFMGIYHTQFLADNLPTFSFDNNTDG